MPSVVWFEIPADDVERAKSFYTALFDWKVERFPGPMEYWHVDTGGSEESLDGGLVKRHSLQNITSYISVDSVDEYAKKVEQLGGKICVSKTAVPQMGYFALCQDTENNVFGLWQSDQGAK